jgi:hypothetical protein
MQKRQRTPSPSRVTKKQRLVGNDAALCFPIDCLLSIFEFSDALTVLFSVPLVCTTWRTIILEHEESIWKRLCYNEFVVLKDEVFPYEIGIQWKKFFISKIEIQHIPTINNCSTVEFTEEFEELREYFDKKYRKMNILIKLNNQQLSSTLEIVKQNNILCWVC